MTTETAAAMTPDELIAVITRGLDADEQKARAALRPDVCCWEFERLAGHDRLIEMYTYEDGTEDSDPIAFFGGPELVEHIARHDPARVLADVESKREAIRLYRDTLDMIRTLKGHGYDAKAHEVASESYLNVLRAFARPYLSQKTP